MANSPLSRTLSMDLIAPSISQLFKRKRNREIEEEETTPEPMSNSELTIETPKKSTGKEESKKAKKPRRNSTLAKEDQPSRKKRRTLLKQQEEFEANEKKLDNELPEELRKFRPKGFKFNLPPTDRPIRIYADGVFDLFHLGHMKQLEQAKKSFPDVQLVCGVPSDIETHKRKGLTVLTDKQRCETLLHCKWVDEVVADAPWCVTTKFLKEHKIDYVAHDDLPYASLDSDDIYKPIKEKGMFLTTQRTEGISTSDIITKIIRDYDKYLMRNFARGATRKELNVSWLKKNELDFKKHINEFRSYWKKNQENLNNVSRDLYFEVREYIRGKKFDMSQFLESVLGPPSDAEDGSINSPKAPSPLTDFAAKYIGNANKELNGEHNNNSNNNNNNKLWVKNVKNWISKEPHDTDLDYEASSIASSKRSIRRTKKAL